MTSDNPRWRKASYSGGQGGNCIEVANYPANSHVLVRDTRDRTGPMLRFAPGVWRSFTEQVKAARSLAAYRSRRTGNNNGKRKLVHC